MTLKELHTSLLRMFEEAQREPDRRSWIATQSELVFHRHYRSAVKTELPEISDEVLNLLETTSMGTACVSVVPDPGVEFFSFSVVIATLPLVVLLKVVYAEARTVREPTATN